MSGVPAAATRLGKRPVPRGYWRLAALSGMASYLDSGLLVAVAVGLAVWRDDFGMGVWMAGAISAVVTFCVAVGSLVGGRLADLFGRRRVYHYDIFCYAAGTAVMAFAPDDVVLFTGALIAGLAAGADLPTSLAVVSEAVPVWARGRLVAFTQVMWTIGITVTVALGYAVSGLGMLGTRIILAHLAAAAAVTWVLRARLEVPGPPRADDLSPAGPATPATRGTRSTRGTRGTPPRSLLRRPVLVPMAATFLFYVAWGIGANTFGQFGTYFLVTVSGASQALATGLNLAFLPVALLMAVVFVRCADTPWRDRLFLVAGVVQVLAFVVASCTQGASLAGMLTFLVLYQFSNPLAGEASYKVWSQLTLPGDTRGTSQGLTYALARAVFALVALFTPVLLHRGPALLLWSLTGCMAVAALTGACIVRVLLPRAPMAVPTRMSGEAERTERLSRAPVRALVRAEGGLMPRPT